MDEIDNNVLYSCKKCLSVITTQRNILNNQDKYTSNDIDDDESKKFFRVINVKLDDKPSTEIYYHRQFKLNSQTKNISCSKCLNIIGTYINRKEKSICFLLMTQIQTSSIATIRINRDANKNIPVYSKYEAEELTNLNKQSLLADIYSDFANEFHLKDLYDTTQLLYKLREKRTELGNILDSKENV